MNFNFRVILIGLVLVLFAAGVVFLGRSAQGGQVSSQGQSSNSSDVGVHNSMISAGSAANQNLQQGSNLVPVTGSQSRWRDAGAVIYYDAPVHEREWRDAGAGIPNETYLPSPAPGRNYGGR